MLGGHEAVGRCCGLPLQRRTGVSASAGGPRHRWLAGCALWSASGQGAIVELVH